MSNLIFIKDNDNNVGIGSNMINDIKGNINITQNLNVAGNVNINNKLNVKGIVGIGTNKPSSTLQTTDTYKLHVYDNTDTNGSFIRIESDTGIHGRPAGIEFTTACDSQNLNRNFPSGRIISEWPLGTNTNYNSSVVQIQNRENQTSPSWINTLTCKAGRVGIGTNNPQGTLHIKDTGGTGHGLKIDGCPSDNSAQLYMLNANYGLAIKSKEHAGNYYFLKCSNDANNTGAIIKDNGRLGINLWEPKAPLHVAGAHSVTASNAVYLYYNGGTVYDSSSYAGSFTRDYAAVFEDEVLVKTYVWVAGTITSSDSRIKTNIVDVPDNLALQQLRSIPCRYYEYIDKLKKGNGKTIGFIAQEVKSVLPMAVSQRVEIIPNIYKVINCTWTSVDDKFNMSSSDLPNVNDVKYKFYVSNVSDYSDEKMIEITGNSDNTFTFDAQYINVFCYGSEVDDFHTIDKDKLFALNFSASQELDRIQQTHIIEIASLKAENTELKTKLNELTNKIKNATTFEDLKNSL
tara:strand:- start:36 stop:1583 length:1548 start_codon:yes stop_codon:yes gene_type:complete